ncbi:uncharacterized protein LOC124706910 [Lolium rigidum]|uniref:uncharacterized protein LOC124706910 n=1 Tax=Lolium rigidum TaxID=89674 RepID=UPI001F5C6F26|nr:uncharacterized protein LOC124706910 [Lolium rigidum]
MGMFGRGASSAQIRALTRMLRRVDRRTKEYVVAKKRKHKDEHEELWELLQELEKKATLLKSAYKLLNDFRIFALSAATWLVFLVDKYADGTTYFVCPYSGYSDVVSIFLFTVKSKAETQQGNGTGTSTAPPRMTNVSSFAWLGEPYMDVNTNLEEAYVKSKWDNSSSWGKKHTFMEATLVKELEEADLKSKLETSSSWGKRSSWGKKLILVKRSSWGKNLFIQKRTPSLTEYRERS